MCLKLNEENANAKIADHDIVCYKLMHGFCDEYGNVGITSPYVGAMHPFNKTITAKGKVTKRNHHYKSGTLFKTIKEGVIHSYSTLEGAVDDMRNYCDGNVIFKAIIPKGTKYYVGYFAGTPSYGSKKLIITDTIVAMDFLLKSPEGRMVSDYLFNNFKTEQPSE
jgi:hypothetical protein